MGLAARNQDGSKAGNYPRFMAGPGLLTLETPSRPSTRAVGEGEGGKAWLEGAPSNELIAFPNNSEPARERERENFNERRQNEVH